MIGFLARSRQVVAALVASLAFLLVIAPAAASSIELFLERGQGPLEEEKEDRGEETQGVHRERSKGPSNHPIPRARRTVRAAPPPMSPSSRSESVAPPRHPSQLSVRRLR
ncbi:MAG: hypothetical protein H0V17_36425 [Deltaproteobacteria bacterium]|nr:hypothetical protein [Deltaproteobacteria bacterium]